MEKHPKNETEQAPVPSPIEAMRRELLPFFKAVLLILVLLTIGRICILQSTPVQGPSMIPTLHDGERILVFKLPAFLSKTPFFKSLDPVQPGDLVVFQGEDDRYYVKRVIAQGPAGQKNSAALAADAPQSGVRVQFLRGQVYVNNHRLQENYLLKEEHRSPDVDEQLLQPGQYYVLGDHRSVSLDSRRFGPIDADQIIGRAVWRFWPLNAFGPIH